MRVPTSKFSTVRTRNEAKLLLLGGYVRLNSKTALEDEKLVTFSFVIQFEGRRQTNMLQITIYRIPHICILRVDLAGADLVGFLR